MSESLVLLVDDSKDDLFLMRHALAQAGVENKIFELPDGKVAIEYLSGFGTYANRQVHPLPCLVVTDLKMPHMDGFELLAWIAQRPEFDSIPRIVLSASGHSEDQRRATELGACAYFVKPGELHRLVDLMKHLDDTWISAHCPRQRQT